ncbi:hypothetical protein QAD02_003630 [Eretmocerus hayati]|uniref:Uncharacterized protein n=1 Tax=Eretmocerus hayati TaxID=131215 RepID=A0ACC2NP30_9HYME|nr:hypothetical protein QAD02_003630 [Eretmocerus hayati]
MLHRRVALLVKNHPILYDKRLRATEKCAELTAQAYDNISLQLWEEYGMKMSSSGVKKVWESQLSNYKKGAMAPGARNMGSQLAGGDCDEDEYISFMDSLIVQRPMLQTSIKNDNHQSRKATKRRRSKGNPQSLKRYSRYPPLDDFAMKKAKSRNDTEASIETLKSMFQGVQSVWNKTSVDVVPTTGTFKSMLRLVKMIPKSEYDNCRRRVLNALTKL